MFCTGKVLGYLFHQSCVLPGVGFRWSTYPLSQCFVYFIHFKSNWTHIQCGFILFRCVILSL